MWVYAYPHCLVHRKRVERNIINAVTVGGRWPAVTALAIRRARPDGGASDLLAGRSFLFAPPTRDRLWLTAGRCERRRSQCAPRNRAPRRVTGNQWSAVTLYRQRCWMFCRRRRWRWPVTWRGKARGARTHRHAHARALSGGPRWDARGKSTWPPNNRNNNDNIVQVLNIARKLRYYRYRY